ncbi:MAG: hypothetical protein ACJ77U_05270 [Chloroflexota bacterium]
MTGRAEICVRNSLHWYEAIFRTHGLSGTSADGVWSSHDDVPPYYSNAMTLNPSPVEPQIAALRELASTLDRAWAVKDSFATLDLGALGFKALFDAEWIWRDPTQAAETDAEGVAWRKVASAPVLAEWERAWRDNGSPTDRAVFLPDLLSDRTIALFAAYQGDSLVGGCAANVSSEAVGFSNFFAADGDTESLRAGALAVVGTFGAGLPVVGYEGGEELERARRIGFQPVGPLRVWVCDRS